MSTLLSLAAALIAGLVFSRLMKKLHLPNVTGYLLAGLLIGPSCFGLIEEDMVSSLNLLVTVALAFIAFSIGGEFKLEHLKAVGKKAVIIAIVQALSAMVVVDAALILLGYDLPLSLTLGAIATATAPAATLMVVRQYRAKGEVTNTLLPVVAIDDAVGLMAFSLSVAVAEALSSGAAMTLRAVVLAPLGEILLSLAIGFAVGVVLAFVSRFFHSRDNFLMLAIAAVLLGVGVSQAMGLSDLLLCMSVGVAYVNLKQDPSKVLDGVDRWTPPLFLLFFVVSGAGLELAALPAVGLLGALYLVARSLGKYFGAYFGAALVKASARVRKYLGIMLLPQAGVAIGMAEMAVAALPAYGPSIRAVVLAATLIYELIGPVCTKIALRKAGEIEG